MEKLQKPQIFDVSFDLSSATTSIFNESKMI